MRTAKRVTKPALCVAALLLAACPTVRVPELMMAAGHTTAANPDSYPLKVHLRSGDLLVLSSWSDLPGDSGLAGRGSRYDVRRHGWTAARSFFLGLGVGAASGVGLAVACSQVSGGCGGVTAGSTLFGGAVGGIAALSYQYSSRWRFRPVTEVKLAPFARFPQGPPPGGFDVLLRPARDSVVVRS